MSLADAVTCLGWDVGGWMGGKQGVAALTWRPGTDVVDWIASPGEFRLGTYSQLTFAEFVSTATAGRVAAQLQNARFVIGVDAPLGYPSAFRSLVGGDLVSASPPDREIDNVFAYRETERHVFERFGKKPLSAPFDKLGNNASVAISHTRRWAHEVGLRIVPFHDLGDSEGAIIEVYPALSKVAGGLASNLDAWMPHEAKPGTDAYDASICALVALAFAAKGALEGLPIVVHPPEPAAAYRDEGWIYYLSAPVVV